MRRALAHPAWGRFVALVSSYTVAITAMFFFRCAVSNATAACVGDVDENGQVTVAELIQGVNAALGTGSHDVITSFDRNGNGSVDIAELIAAVANAVGRCEPAATPTGTTTRANTVTATGPPSAAPSAAVPTASAIPTPTLMGSFEKSFNFDAVVAEIDFPYGASGVTSAMSVDLDANGLLDVLVAVGQNGAQRATWVTLQSAVDLWEPAEFIEGLGGPRALTDLNRDGYLDLLVGDPLGVAWGGPQGIDFRNPQQLSGVDRTPQPDSYNSAITPVDLDRDGLTDLAIAAFGGRDRLLYQESDGSFTELWLDFGLTFSLCPVDFDDDGVPDFISMVDGFFQEDVNEGGAWQQRESRVWSHEPPSNWPMDRYLAPKLLDKGTPMGCAWGDLDGDRELELWLSQVSTSTPIYDRQGGSWADIGPVLPGIAGHPVNEVQGWEVFWGVAIVDFDGDGRDDIAVSGGDNTGHLGQGGISHIGLFIQQASGFDERGRDLGLDETGDFQSLIADDLDNDGRPDILVGQFGGLPRLYLNRLEPRGGMLAVQLRGRAVESIKVEIVGNERSWTMWPGRQSQPLTGARPVLFRGVGAEETLTLRVHWPAGVEEVPVQPRAQPWIVVE